MTKLSMMLYFTLALLILVGCESNTNEASTLESSENSSTIKSKAEDTIRDKSTSASELGKPDKDDSNDGSSEVNTDSTSSKNLHIKDNKDKETLTQYSSKQIEYARVWLQLGANQQIDELYVKHIPAGTPINPDDHTSQLTLRQIRIPKRLNFPEIQLLAHHYDTLRKMICSPFPLLT